MNLVDLIIILLLVLSAVRGVQIGAVRQLLSTVGFLTGLFLGGFISKYFVNLAHTALSRSLLTLTITLLLAVLVLGIGEYVGITLKKSISNHRQSEAVDRAAGSLVSVLTLLLTIWLGAAILVRLPFSELQKQIKNSEIISFLDKRLPPTPTAIADLSRDISPNGFPQVFNGNEPAPLNINTPTPSLAKLSAAVAADEPSVIKVEGDGCGGIVEGSGFVVSSNIVVTNAHVVAGISNPYVFDSNGRHKATVIWFDPDLDFAVLSVNNLSGKPLTINTAIASDGTPAVVMGYPGGGGFTASPAAILDEFIATGSNIYGDGNTNRPVYEIKANVIPGNSGGPLVESNGQVIGIVFAQSTTYNQVGYALTMQKAVNEMHEAEAAHQSVSTGQCAE